MTKKEKKLIAGTLAEIYKDGGNDSLIELYNCGADWLPKEAGLALNGNTEVGNEIEDLMDIELAKYFAKQAGGKFVPKEK